MRLGLVCMAAILLAGNAVRCCPSSSARPSRGLLRRLMRNRTKRQASLACKNADFLTRILTRSLDINRESIKESDPLELGESENFGFIQLYNTRLYNSHTVFILGRIDTCCTDDILHVTVPIGVHDTMILFDFVAPFFFFAGQLSLRMSLFAGNVSLITPISPSRTPNVRPTVTNVKLWSTEDLSFQIHGSAIPYGFLGLALNLIYRTERQAVVELLEYIVANLAQQYIDNNPIPL